MNKYEIKTIMHVRRLGTSVYGNPYFEVIFDDFTSARTRIDGSINYSLENSLKGIPVAIFTTRAGRIWNIVPVDKLPDTTKYRWIVYLYSTMGGFSLHRVTSIEAAKLLLVRSQINYDSGNSATLHPYSEDNWSEAKEYEKIGNPFDYWSKYMEMGPKGGIKVENA